MGYGQGGHLGICFQQSFGTSFVDSLHYFPFISETLTEKIEEIMAESISARYEEPDSYRGMQSIEGDIVMEVHPQLVGHLLKAWSGQASLDGYQGSCYEHRFLPVQAEFTAEKAALPPLTVELYRDTGSAYQYYDCMVNGLNFEISQGALYKVTASMIGANFEWVNKTVPSYEVGSFFTWDLTSVQFSNTAVDGVSAMTIALNNNLAGKAYLDGTRRFSRILRDGHRTIEVGGTVLLEGDDEVRNFLAGTEQPVNIAITDPTTIMEGHNQLVFDIPRMRYVEYPANIGGVGLIEVSFSGKGKYDSTSSYAVQMTLQNTRAVY